MQKKWTNVRDIIRYIGFKSILASTLIFLLTVAATCTGGYLLYRYTKDSILLQGQLNAVKSAKEFDRYLLVRENAVTLASNVVNMMLEEGRSQKEIKKYLETQSQSIQETTNRDSTGLFGWINGEFCDGDGWVPDKDFVPTERPWYIEAMADNSPVTFVKPYPDEKTDSITTSMASKLNDGTSVLTIDVNLDHVQKITEELAPKIYDSYGLVLDKSGHVVAHSDREEVGKNYKKEKNTLGAAITEAIFGNDQKQFEMDFDHQHYIVYAEDIEGNWKSVSLINTEMFYRPLMIILILLFALMMTEAGVFITIFFRLSAKNLAYSIQNVQITAVADMYVTICDIDIPFDSIREIRKGRNSKVAQLIAQYPHDAQRVLYEIINDYVDDSSKSIMKTFCDLSTLDTRMASCDTITEEFLDADKHWCRGRFVITDRNRTGSVIRVMGMIESIDAEKKHRDKLKYLSETDRMTGLNNRATGEGKISELLDQGKGGMLLLLDVDRFKSINDTFGHGVGDKVIIAVADSVKQAFRSVDVVMRLGGDEFVAFAPGVITEEMGSKVIHRIFENIESIHVEELEGHPVRVSVGAAFVSAGELVSFTEIYRQADSCAYKSKEHDGNYCTFYHPGEDDETIKGDCPRA